MKLLQSRRVRPQIGRRIPAEYYRHARSFLVGSVCACVSKRGTIEIPAQPAEISAPVFNRDIGAANDRIQRRPPRTIEMIWAASPPVTLLATPACARAALPLQTARRHSSACALGARSFLALRAAEGSSGKEPRAKRASLLGTQYLPLTNYAASAGGAEQASPARQGWEQMHKTRASAVGATQFLVRTHPSGCHTLQSSFRPNSLKTKNRYPCRVSHFLRGRARQIARFFRPQPRPTRSQTSRAAFTAPTTLPEKM